MPIIMFNDDRSDFAAPIVAFLYIALASIMAMVYEICVDSAIAETDLTIALLLSIGGLVIAGFNMFKGYLPEGFSVALFALYMAAFTAGYSIPAAIGLGVLFAFCAFVCYRTGITDLAVIDAIAAVVSVLMLGIEMHEAIRALVCIAGFVPALVALYVAYYDWTFAQEVIESYEEEFLGDMDEDGCCCCGDEECDCGEHPEGCTCEECTGKESDAPAEDAPAEEPAEAPAEDAPAEEAVAEETSEEAESEEEKKE